MKRALCSILLATCAIMEESRRSCAAFTHTGRAAIPRRNSWHLLARETDTSKASQSSAASVSKQGRTSSPRHRQNKQSRPRNGGDTALQNQKRLNRRLVESETADEIFRNLQQATGALTKTASGGVMNTINFSTSVHRLARHSLQAKARTSILADPRLALLMAGLAEALVDPQAYPFSCRELSNIGWALAKLRIAPPSSALPLTASSSSEDLRAIAKDLRYQIMQASKDKQPGQALRPTWVPTMSKLTGLVLDEIAFSVDRTSSFKQQELSNLLWALATADRANHTIFGKLIRRMMEQEVQQRNPQEWSNVAWAFATVKVYDGMEEMFDFLANLMQDERFVSRFKPQESANTIWGIATLLSNMEDPIPTAMGDSALRIVRAFVPHILETIDHFKTQELSNACWGMATLGFGLNPSAVETLNNNYLALPSESPHLDNELKNECIAAIVEASLPIIHRFRSQELNNLAWSLARLLDSRTPAVESMLHGIGMELSNPRRRVESQDIATTLWSFANLEYFDDRLYRAILSRYTPKMIRHCKVQELSNSLWAVGKAEIDVGIEKDAYDTTTLDAASLPIPNDPVTIFFGDAAVELLERPQHFKPQEMKDILWSFSRTGIRHPELFKRTAEYLVGREEEGFATCRGLHGFSTQAIGNMAWAYARQAQLAEEVADRHGSMGVRVSLTNGRLAVKSAICFDIGEGLLHRLFHEIAETELKVFDGLNDLRPQDMSNTAWTFGVLGIRHDAFIDACMKQLEIRTRLYLSGKETSMTFFKGQEISNLLWSIATLNVSSHGLLESVGPYLQSITKGADGKISTESIASVFKRQELANIAWSCAVFGEYPSDLMSFLYGGLLGNHNTPSDVASAYQDGGMQQQCIMTLLYVQAAMDLSRTTHGLSLPPNFPDGWQQNAKFIGDNAVLPTSELTLSVSKIQRSVSEAFRRIGFDHVVEHIISMAGLASDYGVNLPPQQVEVLSIDIADVARRIAVEVDGPAHFVTSIEEEGGSVGFAKMNSNGKFEYNFAWAGDRQLPNGSTAMKQRLLSDLGWKTINIPFWEWYRLEGPEEEEEYCRSQLRQYIGA